MFHTTNQATVQKPKLSRFRLLLDEGYANSSYYIFSFISQWRMAQTQNAFHV